MAKILLIEDLFTVRKAVGAMLANAGHTIVEAEDGQIAINLLEYEKFNLVITDILMPNKDGTEVIMHLQRMTEAPPVLAMSGGGANLPADIALLVARTKADAVLMKPFEQVELIETVDGLLDTRAA